MNGNFKDSNLGESTGFKAESEYSRAMSKTHQSDNLRVVIRVRPALPREMEVDLPFRSIVK